MTIEQIWILVEGVLLFGALIWLGIAIRLIEKQDETIQKLINHAIATDARFTEVNERISKVEPRYKNL